MDIDIPLRDVDVVGDDAANLQIHAAGTALLLCVVAHRRSAFEILDQRMA
jgi:hypothetical protein